MAYSLWALCLDAVMWRRAFMGWIKDIGKSEGALDQVQLFVGLRRRWRIGTLRFGADDDLRYTLFGWFRTSSKSYKTAASISIL